MQYFSKEEFVMGGSNVFDKMDSTFLFMLDDLRGRVGTPLKINSSYRSPSYNKSIGGASKSMHLTGRAVDIQCTSGVLRARIIYEALNMGMTCGVAKGFVHVDNRDNQIVYTY